MTDASTDSQPVASAPRQHGPDARFIVTGGAGFIGSNLVAALNRRGHDNILVVDHLDEAGIKQRNLSRLTIAGYQDKQDFRRTLGNGSLDKPVTVFHLGACSSTTETNEAYLTDNNVRYTRELCQWCLDNGVRFIYASSAATYGDGSRGYSDSIDLVPALQPLNLYGASKQTFDVWARENDLFGRIAGIKYFNVYGPWEDHKDDMRSLVNKAYKQIRDTGEMRLFRSHRPDYRDGEQMRDFVYVSDAVNVTLYFHDHPTVSGLFNCGTGQARTWIDLARAIFAAMDREPRITFIDMPDSIRDRYQYYTEAEMTKLRSTGYSTPFTSIEAGVGEYVRSYLCQQNESI